MVHVSAFVLAAAAVVSASPVALSPKEELIRVPVTHNVQVKNIKNIVQKGQDRLKKVNGEQISKRSASSGAITNDDVSYLAPVNIGGSTYQLIVDTGSSNTWCGAQSQCEPSNTGSDTGNSVSVSYGSGSFSGEEYTDNVSFGGKTVQGQSIGAASSSQGFQGVDGIIGFGPADLTQNTVSGVYEVPTFMDNLYSSGAISTEVLGVSFAPEPGSDSEDTNGELTLGGVDSSKYSGSLAYVPTLQSGSAAPYWGVDVTSFTYNGVNLGSATSNAIVDTGTTLIYVPTTVYNKFLSATKGTTDSSSGLASFTTKPTANFVVKLKGATLTLTPSQFLIPSSQYSNFGITNTGKYYSWINNGGSSGVDTILGQKLLENYYAAFDTTNARIGFAPRA